MNLLKIRKFIDENPWAFICTMWLLSRLVIVVSLLIIAPLLPINPKGIVVTPDLGVFQAWDSNWYEIIALMGYSYANDGQQHSVAFFPLFPICIRFLMNLGFSFKIAGIIINNIAFFSTLMVVYHWVNEMKGKKAAQWTIAFLAFCPFSLFGTVIYTEGLFLLLTTTSLYSFQKQKYILASICGALASACRPPGVILVPTFLFIALRERRGVGAYLSSLFVGIGIGAYSLFCQIKFGDFLAFAKVQKAWQPSDGTFHGWDWIKMVTKAIFGRATLNYNWLADPWYPLLFFLICFGFYWVWRSRTFLGERKTQYAFFLLGFLLWLRGETPMLNTMMVFGGMYLLWKTRSQLPLILVIYGFLSLGLILSGGVALSPGRLVYGIISLSIALGLTLSKYPYMGYPTLVFCSYLLSQIAIRFAQQVWAG